MPNDQHSFERTFLAPCQCNFKSGTTAIGKTRMAFSDKQNDHCMEAAIFLTKDNQRHLLFQQKAGSPWKTDNRWLATTSQLHSFALHLLCSRSLADHGSCRSILILAQPPVLQKSRLKCSRDQQGFEEHSWHHACTTSKVAPVRLARPGWLFETAAWVHGGCHRT